MTVTTGTGREQLFSRRRRPAGERFLDIVFPAEADPVAYVRDITHGEMCATVVEAIGLSPLALAAVTPT